MGAIETPKFLKDTSGAPTVNGPKQFILCLPGY